MGVLYLMKEYLFGAKYSVLSIPERNINVERAFDA